MGISRDALKNLFVAFEAHLDALKADADDDSIDDAYDELAEALDRYTIAVDEEFDEELPYDVVEDDEDDDDGDELELDPDDIDLLLSRDD